MFTGLDIKKAAHVAAYFALKAGGTINVLKISKLLYLAERESMRLHDEPMFFDQLVSMDRGPVVSTTLDLINGREQADEWSETIAPRQGLVVRVQKGVSFKELDELSRADRAILESLWEKFKNFNQFDLQDWTHDNCAEWNDPQGTSTPINYEDVFFALDKEAPAVLAEHAREQREFNRMMAITRAL